MSAKPREKIEVVPRSDIHVQRALKSGVKEKDGKTHFFKRPTPVGKLRLVCVNDTLNNMLANSWRE